MDLKYIKKVGIIGMGRIGNKISKILNAFEASIYSYDKENKKINIVKYFFELHIKKL